MKHCIGKKFQKLIVRGKELLTQTSLKHPEIATVKS